MITKHNGYIDIHTHILPDVDDGSTSVQMSVQMLREEYAQGARVVALTPHFYAEHRSPASFLEKRDRAYGILTDALRSCQEQAFPSLLPGAEVLYYDGMSESTQLRSLCIAGTNLLLVEMPFREWSSRILSEVGSIHDKQGIIPVVAHLDRYYNPYNRNGMLDQLMDMDVLIQMNTECILNRSLTRWGLRLIGEGRIHFLGTDCHNLSDRSPNLKGAMERLAGRAGGETAARFSQMAGMLFDHAKFGENMGC